jgi:hypothetical protein
MAHSEQAQNGPEVDDDQYQPYHQGGLIWDPPLVLTPEQQQAKQEKEQEHGRKFLSLAFNLQPGVITFWTWQGSARRSRVYGSVL